MVIKASKAQGVGERVFNAATGTCYTLNLLWKTLNEIEDTNNPGQLRGSRARAMCVIPLADTTLAVKVLGHDPHSASKKACAARSPGTR
jgi:nucleoside-diphosphate-sugar epimerase